MKENSTEDNIISKIFNIISKALLLVFVVFSIIILIRVVVFKKLDVFGYKFYIILSDSMSPVIKKDDIVVVKQTTEIKKGDIIAFEAEGCVFVHRVKEIEDENLYKTQGDANNVEDDELIKPEQIKGVAVRKLPKLGIGILFIKKHLITSLVIRKITKHFTYECIFC